MSKYYVTTPIYYVNDHPHLGHMYTTIAADVLARYQRLQGDDVFFLTGVDEHGQKVQEAAQAKGLEPIELADAVVERYQELWPKLSISHNDFIRTSEERHKQVVQSLWKQLSAKGAIYKGVYEDWYCVPCETYCTQTQLEENDCCPDCHRPVQKVKEESYFFRLSDYQQQLLDHIHQNPGFIAPLSRRNEVISFVESGLRDLSISRTTFSWGVPVPGDEKHVIYVWIDALSNYLSALGYPDGKHADFWPASVHLVGKDILRFHAVYWPCMLMAAGLPLPKRIFAHGWWTVEGKKMSKSLGNALRPDDLLENWDADVLRYFLLREVPFGSDGDFSEKALIMRYNSELANDIGNLLNRSLSMLQKYRQGILAKPTQHDFDVELCQHMDKMPASVHQAMQNQAFHNALEALNSLVRHGNRYVEQTAPWKLAKEGDFERLDTVLYHLVDLLRLIALYLSPFMPNKAQAMMAQIMNVQIDLSTFDLARHGNRGNLTAGHVCGKPHPLFPRMI